MRPLPPIDRRRFVQEAVGGAIAAAAATSVPSSASAARFISPRGPSPIQIGTRITPEWLASKDDADLKFLKQIGVDAVDVELIMVKGYEEHGVFTREALRELM